MSISGILRVAPFGLVGLSFSVSNLNAEVDLQLDPSVGDFSIEAIVRFDAGEINRSIVRQQDGTGKGRDMLYRTPGGSLRSYLGGDATSSSSDVSIGVWHHVVMTVEENGANDTIRFYIDGQFAGSGGADVESADGKWVIGANNFFGGIDELAVYTNLLSATRVSAHYTVVFPIQEHAGDSPVHYVSPDGTATYPYTNWATAALFIQDAVDASSDGDTVQLREATYALNETILVTNAITVQGGRARGDFIVDCQNQVRGFYLSNDCCVISGLNIRNGMVESGVDAFGGGIYCETNSCVVTNCWIENCFAFAGGGGCYQGTLFDCLLIDNETFGSGGGVDGGLLTGCRLLGNSAAVYGGGVVHGFLERCTLFGNAADNSGGGTAFCLQSMCVFSENSANKNRGGGSYQGTSYNCILTNNTARIGGGSSVDFLYSCTLSDNEASEGGGGIHNSTAYNCIIWNNTSSGSGPEWAGTLSEFACCCTAPLPAGSGNINTDPCFSDSSLC